MVSDYECPLCKAEYLSRRYHDCSLFWIADCVTCKVPMVVLEEHKADAPQWIVDEMLQVCKGTFDMDKYDIDFTNKTIHDHYHFHLRPKKEEETTADEEQPEE